jgi:hypothetical protein
MMVLIGCVFTTFSFLATLPFVMNPDTMHPVFGVAILCCFFLVWGYFGIVFSQYVLK